MERVAIRSENQRNRKGRERRSCVAPLDIRWARVIYTVLMFWTEEIAAKCSGAHIINDSKTPSGRVHVGALRGVLIHDAIFRTLGEKGIEVRYLFGVDD